MGDEFGFILDTLNFRWKIWGGVVLIIFLPIWVIFFENSSFFQKAISLTYIVR